MAVQGSSNENATGKQLFVGLENFNILAVNPSLEKLKELGFNYEKDPVYISKEKDKDNGDAEYTQIRVDFVIDNNPNEGEPHIREIASYYIDNRNIVSSTGKTQFTNKFGQFTWLESMDNIPENMRWFLLDGIRSSFRGEEALMGMLRNFTNVSKGGECYIEKPVSLLAGNVAEIREYINMFLNNKVKMLLVVKNVDKKDDNGTIIGVNHYQGVYTRKTERPYSTDFSYLQKDITQWTANGGGAKLEFPEYPYKLTLWEEVVADDSNIGMAPTGQVNW